MINAIGILSITIGILSITSSTVMITGGVGDETLDAMPSSDNYKCTSIGIDPRKSGDIRLITSIPPPSQSESGLSQR